MNITHEKSGDCAPASNVCLFISDALKNSTYKDREQFFFRRMQRAIAAHDIDPCHETRSILEFAQMAWRLSIDDLIIHGGAHD